MQSILLLAHKQILQQQGVVGNIRRGDDVVGRQTHVPSSTQQHNASLWVHLETGHHWARE